MVELVLTRHRSDSALAKWHAACGTWAQEADCFLLWRKACREGRGVEDGEQSGSAQTIRSPSSSLLPDSFCSGAAGEGRVRGSCRGRKGRRDAALDGSHAVCVGGSETRGPRSSVQICRRVWKLDVEERFPCNSRYSLKLHYLLCSLSVGFHGGVKEGC